MNSSNVKWVFAAIILAACVAIFFGYRVDNGNWLEVHNQIQHELQGVMFDYRNAQIAEQGYVLGGGDFNYKAFKKASADGVKRLLNLRTLSVMDPRYAESYRALDQEIRSSFEQMNGAVSMRAAQNINGAASRLQTNRTEEQALSEKIRTAEGLEAQLVETTAQAFVPAINSAIAALCGLTGLFAISLPLLTRKQPQLKDSQKQVAALMAELSAARTEIDRLANIDFLTQVLNERGLVQALAVEQKKPPMAGNQLVAVLMSCDNLRKISDQLGHAIADLVLKEIAARTTTTLRPTDRIARVDTDEFVVLLTETQLSYAMRVADRLRTVISEPLKIGADIIKPTISMGLAALPPDAMTLEEVYAVTKPALKQSQSTGKNRVQVRDVEPASAPTSSSLAKIAPAVKNGKPRDIVEILTDGADFKTKFQPIVDLAQEKISGYELFSRGPDGGFESPADFFKICIDNNVLTTVDLKCLKHSLATIADAPGNLRYYINLFPSTLLDTPIESLISIFPEDRKDKVFVIELSEQQFAGEPSYMREHVNALKQSGILVAIDDVGFGRSSLESLILLEPDVVKIDRKYVTGVSREPAKARLLRRVVNVGKSLGAQIVAEGIEVKDDLPILKDVGVHYGQGYFWGNLLDKIPTEQSLFV